MKKLTLCLILGLSTCQPAFSDPVITHKGFIEFTEYFYDRENAPKVLLPTSKIVVIKEIHYNENYVQVCIDASLEKLLCYNAKTSWQDFINAINEAE